MFSALDKYVAVFLTGFVVTYVLTPLVRSLAVRYGVVDMPNERRPHKRPTARGGGIAVVFGVHAACLVWLALPWPDLAGGFEINWWRHMAVASAVLAVVGLIDDIRGLRPLVKLAGQVLAAIIVCHGGTKFGEFFGVDLPNWLDAVLVVVWLVGVINAFNLIDGLDGLASGLACISAAGLCGIFLVNHSPGNMLPLIGLIGACLAFLRYNLHPATIFLGDTGSMFIGFVLGLISLQTFNKSTFLLSMSIPMLVLGIPIFDALLAIWRRSVRVWVRGKQDSTLGKRLGVMQPDLDHLHHRLLEAGLSTRRVSTVLCVGNAALVVFGLLITTFKSHASGIFLIALLCGAYVLLRHLAVLELRETGRALLAGLRRPTHSMLKSLLYPVWDMVALSGAWALAMKLSNPPATHFWDRWFLDLPIWVTPTISLLALSRTYVIVWTRARVLDVLMLVFTLQVGLLISLGLTLLIDPANSSTALMRTLMVAAVAQVCIVSVRILYRCVEEMVHYLRSKGEIPKDSERIVLYGAGGRCQLFLKERGFNDSSSFDGRALMGLIDDEPSLHFQWVYGHLVLGGLADLPRLIDRYRVNGIVVTALLKPESLDAVKEIARLKGISLSEWRFENRQLEVPKPEAGKAVETSVQEGKPQAATATAPPPAQDFERPIQHAI